MRCKLQPELRCAGSSQIRVHMLTHSMSCSLSSIRGRKPRQWTPRLCHALTYLLFFISWIPQITLALPHTSPHMRPFPWKREAENIHAISHALLSQFFSSFIGELSGLNQSDARFVELDRDASEHVERSVLDPEHSFVAVRRTT